MIHALFFDFNGVIIDDEPLQLKAYQEAFEPEGVTLTEKDYYDALGMDDRTFVRAIFERAGKPLDETVMGAVIGRKSDLHRLKLEDELPLFPGIVTFVKHAARRYQLGISSMAQRVEIDDVLRRARLDSAFTVIVSAEDATACKPDPCCYRRALELLNEKRQGAGQPPIKPDDCLVIEDSPPGIVSGRAAGMRTLGVTNTVSEEALRAAGAEVVTRSLADWNVEAVHHIYDRDEG
ncbi:MAG TPA: HAD family phosphatase [Pyrinomonadaceae bacterium]|jgi:phosphoglycolate phosphatase